MPTLLPEIEHRIERHGGTQPVEWRRRRLALLACISLLASCQNYGTLQVASDHDESVDFSRFRTYAQAAPPRARAGDPRYNEIAGRRIAGWIDEALQSKGLRPAAWNQADLQIAFTVDGRPRTEIWVTDVGWYHSRVSSSQLLQGSLTIDMADRQQRRIVWHGVARQDTLADDFDDQHAQRAVEAVLSKYPPQSPQTSAAPGS